MIRWQSELDAVLRRWQGTPWVAGQQACQQGVDCVRFVVAVLDELHGLDLPPIVRLPQDMSLHDREGAMRVAMSIERRYPHAVLKTDLGVIEPGDVILQRVSTSGGPGHVLIAGTEPAVLWHAASGSGVARTSIGALGGRVTRIWRPTEKATWQQRS